jgi:RNA polymerase sigma-70 factor (ECF subfamily)
MSSPVPDTRNSLILRLADKGDAEAWGRFVAVYEPLVYRLARAKGFQDADAREVVQEVLMAVSRAVERWDADPQKGRFRDWLFRIARNLMINHLTRRKHRPLGTGDSAVAELLAEYGDPTAEESAMFDLEYRREAFRWAASQVQAQVKPATWRAFWLTSVEGRAIVDVAEELNMTAGAIHIAKSRVIGRLREAVKMLDESES